MQWKAFAKQQSENVTILVFLQCIYDCCKPNNIKSLNKDMHILDNYQCLIKINDHDTSTKLTAKKLSLVASCIL